MSNFGAGQGLFGNSQNKNQGTAPPGSTPAAGPSAFGGLGSNTTSASAFGGAGAGNTLGGGGTASAPTGSIFGTGGGAFGSGGNTNTSTSTPSGAGTGGTGSPFGGSSLFAANPATNTGSTAPAPGGGLFANSSSNPGTSGTTPGQQSLFGNATGPTTGGGTGGPLFGFQKPAAPGASPFASGTGASTGTSGSGGNLFPGSGNSSATGSTTAAATGTSAGSSTLGGSLFGNNKPADSAAKPATSSFFSAPTAGGATSTGTTATGNTSSMFSNLGARPSETSTSLGTTPSTQPQAGGNAFRPPGTGMALTTPPANQPGFSLGGSAATGDKAASTTAPAGGGLFGNIGAAANKDGEKKGGTSTAPSTFSLGGQSTGTATAPAAPTTEKRDGAAAPSLFSGLGGATSGIAKPAMSLGGSSSIGTTSGTQPFPTTTTSAISVAPPSMLKGKSIEEIINRWSTDLEVHVRDFNKFASEVAVWDRSLIENGNNLAALYSHVLAAEREQNDIDQSLDHIEQQEKELTATVEMYEKQMSDILGGQSGTLRTLDTGPADTERDKNYMLATELHNHLDDLSSSLTQLIDSVNTMSIGQNDTKKVSADDPMAQIAHVLSNHLESLQWIDGASRELEEKVVEVEKRIKDVGTGSQVNPALGGGSRSRGFGLIR